MFKTCLALTLLLAPMVAQSARHQSIEKWSTNHPEASKALGEWVRMYSEAAKLFFEWDGNHPAKSKEFVTWSIRHPKATIDEFVAKRPGWPVFSTIMESHRPAAEAFMEWCRSHPRAAEALMLHSKGLEWAGHHLYKEYWQLEHPK